jgi:hypothetical protein
MDKVEQLIESDELSEVKDTLEGALSEICNIESIEHYSDAMPSVDMLEQIVLDALAKCKSLKKFAKSLKD